MPPNFKWHQEVAIAVRTSNTIDFIDRNPRALEQVIWGIAHPNDCHPGVQSIVNNPALVDLLLIRHFKAHGGLVLPPLQGPRELQEAHEIMAREEIARRLTWDTGRSMMHYPNWRDTRNQAPPPGFGAASPASRGYTTAQARGGRDGGFAGRAGGRGRGGYGG